MKSTNRAVVSCCIFSVFAATTTTVVDAWSPGGLLRLGRQRRMVKYPVTALNVLKRPTNESINISSISSSSEEKEHIRKGDVPSEAPKLHIQHNDDDSLTETSQNGNRRVPEIHLPPRLAPKVGWQHHHKATTHFVHGRMNRNVPVEIESLKEEEKRDLLVSRTPEWKRLEAHKEEIEQTHLRSLLQDKKRCNHMYAEHDGVYLDYSRQRATRKTMRLLQDLAKRQKLEGRIKSMFKGDKINFTEKRAVLHTALRADRDEEVYVDGQNVIEEVHEVLDQIKAFTEGVRSGAIRGYTGKRLRNVISVGIGGSYLGPEFLHEVLKTEPEGINAALGYNLRFLANVDPVDVERTCADLDPEETLIVIVSKTFTTAETMLNARTMRQWLWDFMGNDKEVVRKHMVACASVSATEKVEHFGIDTDNYFFRFWDWVGGRYSVCSAAGAVPLSLLYGFDLFEKFLKVGYRIVRIALFVCRKIRS